MVFIRLKSKYVSQEDIQIMKPTDVRYQNGMWYWVLQIESTYPASCMTPASVK